MPTVTMLRNHGPYRAGATVQVADPDARWLIATGRATPSSTEAPARNASRDEWATYAAALGHHVTDDHTRADLIQLTGTPDAPATTTTTTATATPEDLTED